MESSSSSSRGGGGGGGGGGSSCIFDVISVKGSIVDHIVDNFSDDILHFQLHTLFRGKSYRSQGMSLRDTRSLVFDEHAYSIPLDAEIAKTLSADGPPIMMYLTCYSLAQSKLGKNGIGIKAHEQTLLAEASIDVSTLKIYQDSYLSIELIPSLHDFINTGGDSSVGSIFIKVANFQPLASSIEVETAKTLISQKQSLLTARSRQLFHAVKSFWARLQSEHHHLNSRQLRFIAEDECGRLRFVGSFISPMASQRQIDGPRFAARFVSLIPYRREMALSGSRVNRWQSGFSTLSCLRGDVEDHCVLLCNLLLGWGFNAYVVMGNIHASSGSGDGSQSHTWVMTFDDSNHITFWESLTGEQISFPHSIADSLLAGAHGPEHSPLRDSHFNEIFAIFRHDEYLVNIQTASGCTITNYDVKNANLWRRFSVPAELMDSTTHTGSKMIVEDWVAAVSTATAPSTMIESPIYALEERLESGIRDWLLQMRFDRGLSTNFDEALCRIMHPALLAYEIERAHGSHSPISKSLLKDFQVSVKRVSGKGVSFKAFPTCFNHSELNRVLHTLSRSKTALEVAYCVSHKSSSSEENKSPQALSSNSSNHPVRFGVRAQIFTYPRGVCALWIIIASCYHDKA